MEKKPVPAKPPTGLKVFVNVCMVGAVGCIGYAMYLHLFDTTMAAFDRSVLILRLACGSVIFGACLGQALSWAKKPKSD